MTTHTHSATIELRDWKDAVPDAAPAFRALADATRLQIMALIAAGGDEQCVCNIVDAIPLSQPTISYHLNILRSAGLIKAAKRGVWVYYSINEGGLAQLGRTLSNLQSFQGGK